MEKVECRERKERTRWKWKRVSVENGRRERGVTGREVMRGGRCLRTEGKENGARKRNVRDRAKRKENMKNINQLKTIKNK